MPFKMTNSPLDGGMYVKHTPNMKLLFSSCKQLVTLVIEIC